MPVEGYVPFRPEDVERYLKNRWWLDLTWGDIFNKATDLYPVIIPTGGTTGTPKAVPRAHNDYITSVEHHNARWDINRTDVILTVAPVSHGQGMQMGVGGSFYHQAKFVLCDSTQPEDICRVIEREKVTAFPTVPAVVQRIITFDRLKDFDLSSLKKIYSGGGETISAVGIEHLLGSHPAVAEVAVIGMPDKEFGERICAYVQCRPGMTLGFEEMIAHLKSVGASVMQLPERLELIESMPLTKVGKRDKKALKEDIERKLKAVQFRP